MRKNNFKALLVGFALGIGGISAIGGMMEPIQMVYADECDFVIEDGVLKKYEGTASHVVIPNGVTSIGEHAFRDCTSLISIEIPGSVIDLGACAFWRCTNLKNVVLNEGLQAIYGYAFADTAIENIKLPNSLKTFEYTAINGCKNITEFYLPRNVSAFRDINSYTIDDAIPFNECTNLKKLIVDKDNEYYSSTKDNKAMVSKDGTLIAVVSDDAKYNIPEEVTYIGVGAFSNCLNLKEIEIPNTVEGIGPGAFYYCTGIERAYIGENVSYIGVIAFEFCKNLKSVCIHTKIANIYPEIFEGCINLSDICFLGSEEEWNSIKEEGFYEFPKELKIHFGHTEVIDKAVAATTTSTGLTEGSHCSVCKEIIKAQTVVPKLEEKPLVTNPFTDIPDGKWYTDAVLYVQRRGAMTGTTSTTFAPLDNLTRGMTATLLWKLEGSVPYAVNVFPDVKTSSWYGSAVAWAKNNGIVGGYSSGEKAGTFGPKNNITRQDFIKILYQYAQFKGYNTKVKSSDSYTKVEDGSLISKYAREAMNWGYENELIANNSLFKPKDNITRRETATIIARFLQAFDPE